ncbi:MAG TPA: SNF2-related protein, partial [Chitinophagaceae bacterium]|nr:SNF2-related protein [Chitinophagaceae bacterium]
MSVEILQTDHGYKVSFPYHPQLVEGIKRIHGARFNKTAQEKFWLVPQTSEQQLMIWAKNNNGAVTKKEAVDISIIDELPDLTIDIPLKRDLFPYQKKGVAYSLQKKRLIVGDQPGLGKTGQAIATIVGAGAKCTLVICPATLRENWKREWKIWTGDDAMILNDRVKTSWHQYYRVGACKIFITNYESLKKFFVAAINKPEDKPLRLNHIQFKETIDLFDAVIIDESHRCKDGKTQQSKFCMGIAKGKEYVLCLTGTPVVNKPIDLIPQLHIINRVN